MAENLFGNYLIVKLISLKNSPLNLKIIPFQYYHQVANIVVTLLILPIITNNITIISVVSKFSTTISMNENSLICLTTPEKSMYHYF
jgi:hypothetical protein